MAGPTPLAAMPGVPLALEPRPLAQAPEKASGTGATGMRPAEAPGDVAEAAKGFEAILLRQMLKDLRKTAAFEGDSSYSTGFYNDMFDDFLADHLARSGGLGLTEVIKAYVSRSPR